MYCNGVQSYRKTNVNTSNPARLIILCYEGAIDSLKLAKQKMKEKDYKKKQKAIINAHDIINELLCSLDFERGGEIAINLSSLYNYMIRRILHGDVNRDMGAIDEVIGMLNELLFAWRELALKPERQIQTEQDSLYCQKSAVGSGYISV